MPHKNSRTTLAHDHDQVISRPHLLLAILPLLAACRTANPNLTSGIPASDHNSSGASQSVENSLPARPRSDTAEEAEESGKYENIYRKASLQVGGVSFASFTTTAQVSGSAGIGAVLDLEDVLGVSSSTNVLRVDGEYMLNGRNRLSMSYYDINRDGSRTIVDDIDVGDVTIPAGQTSTKMRTTIGKIAYLYSFVDDDRTVISGSFGLHIMDINLKVKSPTFDIEEDLGVTAPLPVLGLHGAYALSESWSLFASGEVFQLKIDNFGGSISDIRVGLDWDIFEHLGVGAEINVFSMNADVDDGDMKADIEYGYQGIGLYLRAYL